MIKMRNLNNSLNPITDRPPEYDKLMSIGNQAMMETRKNRQYPWLKIFLIVLVCALLLAGVILTLLAVQNTQSNSTDKTSFYLFYKNDYVIEGRIYLLDPHASSVEQIAKFDNWLRPFEVATTPDKIFAIDSYMKLFEIFSLKTRQISKGPNPPEWRKFKSVAYYKDKVYYLGGEDPKTRNTNQVDILINEKWKTRPAFPLSISRVQTITCNEILYVIDGWNSEKIYRLSDDEREWIEIGEIPEKRALFGATSLNGKIYITGGWNGDKVFKSCLCFDPSAPVGSQISRIADMNYARHHHSLVAANGKLFAIGGFQSVEKRSGSEYYWINFCDVIEEYDPQTNEWREIGKINLQIDGDNSSSNSHEILFQFFYQNNNGTYEGRIGLFDSHNFSVEEIAKFHNSYMPYKVATTQNKIFGISNGTKLFEIYDLNTRMVSRGPAPPEWREWASVAYFKDKLYYLGGEDPKTKKNTDRVDVLIDGIWQTGPAFPLQIMSAQTITCDGILYAIDGLGSRKIYRLSDDEREWIEIGELPERRDDFGAASLNGKIYITGGLKSGEVFKSCWCFDPSAPVGSRISRIADMNYARWFHSLVVANEKLYAIGGSQNTESGNNIYYPINFCGVIEEYDPQTNKWREIGKVNLQIDGDNSSSNSHEILFQYLYLNNDKYEGRIGLFNSYTWSVEEIAKFYNCYERYEVTTTQNKIFGIRGKYTSFEIYDLDTRKISRGPDPPEWRNLAYVAYLKDKLYYLGGEDPKTKNYTNQVDVLIDGTWQTGPALPLPIKNAQTITHDGILYVIDGWESNKIYRLSDNEREWIEVGKIPKKQYLSRAASLSGRIYIAGGYDGQVLKSCLCFNPSAPVGSQISQIADMNFARVLHSLIVANGKLYAIGGFQNTESRNGFYYGINFCDVIEEYDPQTNKWREVGKLKFE